MKRHPFLEPMHIINIGFRPFAETLHKMQVEIVHVDWHPKPSHSVQIENLLSRLTKKQ